MYQVDRTAQRYRLAGKVAVVTGAARGVGRACAVALAEAGADLLVLDIGHDVPGLDYPLGSASQLAYTVRLCRERRAAVVSTEADVRDVTSVRAAVEAALIRFGRIDVVVNNAGITASPGLAVYEISPDQWSLDLDVDVSGAWRMISAVGQTMISQRAGSIINVAGTAGLVGYRNLAGHVTAKHALVGLTRAAALDFAPFQVRVNALCPGPVRDDPVVEGRMLAELARSRDDPADRREQALAAAQPMQTLVEAGDVAAAAVWLASDESRQVTGSVITVDGGLTAG